MKRIKYIILSIIALTIISCDKDDFGGKESLTSFSQVSVGMADLATTRTYIGDNNAMLWSGDESIGIFSDVQGVEQFNIIKDKSDQNNAAFSGNTVEGNKFYAFYPYAQDVLDKDNKSLLHLNVSGAWVDNGKSSMPMVASSTTSSFLFKQVMGLIKITLTGDSHINAITIKGNKNELIAGAGTIDLSKDTPLFVLDNSSREVSTSISCGDIQLVKDKPTMVYFPMPVMTLEEGFTLTIEGKRADNGKDYKIEKTTNDAVAISRAMIKSFSGVDTDAILKAEDDELILERQALIDLYNSTNGANWTRNDNWGSDKPLNEWFGVSVDEDGHVNSLQLTSNNLSGTIPESIGNIKRLNELLLADNNFITGEIPDNIGNLVNLTSLALAGASLTGSIPESIGKLTKLEELWLRFNQLTGIIPASIGELTKLKILTLDQNQLTGEIPQTLANLNNLSILWLGYNQLSGSIPEWLGYMTELRDLRLNNNNLTGNIPVSLSKLDNLEEFMISGNKLSGEVSQELINSKMWNNCTPYLFQQGGYELIYKLYASTDYSKDGNVIVLQNHTKGNGIKLVFMGEAYSDKLINDGTYDETMKKGMEYFFDIEPFTSFRDYFDVYYVIVVSENELVGENTGLQIKEIGGMFNYPDEYVKSYASRVEGLNNSLSDVTTIVLLHTNFSCRVNTAMYDDGFSIALSSSRDGLGAAGGFAVDMMTDIWHEAGGHGFGHLADEYYEADEAGNTVYPQEEWSILDEYHAKGWSLNLDYHNDPNEVVWKDFISNHDYDIENIGVYEGGAAYCTFGIYRPTDYSIMHGTNDYNMDFNAPSRWAIYQRIMQLAGEEYSFESFLEYDKKNLAAIAATRNYVEKPTVSKVTHGAPPRIFNYPSSEIGRH